ncbi:hypothetical protein EFER_3214 [Escherichia fergusonii ATCC 35469]|uniref:Uncharacterized protein n=1 Tax=Escherichia fergusonii (strain ATCC 35469 / DSM 13698 / CCUG 18766 / IAM 14443 / JCM 21226 / LMG 7866 / NBRC 102419 / NCTC 12128 / CDC 0568-73) TaxID=585054 RepID=B7LRL1_ESCF3|nr:hypothetical protein EFER_3214 [Escherichia fergusonii ATCC 35469]
MPVSRLANLVKSKKNVMKLMLFWSNSTVYCQYLLESCSVVWVAIIRKIKYIKAKFA